MTVKNSKIKNIGILHRGTINFIKLKADVKCTRSVQKVPELLK
jgi:hypothetical protein